MQTWILLDANHRLAGRLFVEGSKMNDAGGCLVQRFENLEEFDQHKKMPARPGQKVKRANASTRSSGRLPSEQCGSATSGSTCHRRHCIGSDLDDAIVLAGGVGAWLSCRRTSERVQDVINLRRPASSIPGLVSQVGQSRTNG